MLLTQKKWSSVCCTTRNIYIPDHFNWIQWVTVVCLSLCVTTISELNSCIHKFHSSVRDAGKYIVPFLYNVTRAIIMIKAKCYVSTRWGRMKDLSPQAESYRKTASVKGHMESIFKIERTEWTNAICFTQRTESHLMWLVPVSVEKGGRNGNSVPGYTGLKASR